MLAQSMALVAALLLAVGNVHGWSPVGVSSILKPTAILGGRRVRCRVMSLEPERSVRFSVCVCLCV